MSIGKRTLGALMGLALCTTLVGGVLTGCDLETRDQYNQQDSTGVNDPGASSLTAPEPPSLGTDRDGGGS